MSLRLRFVIMFETVVSRRLPTLCQKYRTRCGRELWKRDPKTTSARPSSRGASSSPYSAGSYSQSASWTTT